jgi:hypothetical protein
MSLANHGHQIYGVPAFGTHCPARGFDVFPHPFLHHKRHTGEPVAHLLILDFGQFQFVFTKNVHSGQFAVEGVDIVIRSEQRQVKIKPAQGHFSRPQFHLHRAPFFCLTFHAREENGVG